MGFLDRLVRPNKKDVAQKEGNVRDSLLDMLAGNYSTDKEVGRMAALMVKAIENAGDREPDFGGLNVVKMRKMATLALKADADNAEIRFRPGSRLRTYIFDKNSGILKDETFGGKAFIAEGTTIYRNMNPLVYPNNHPDVSKIGKTVRGRFEDDGTFVEDESGPDTLYNEYATDNPDHPRKKYGIEPKPGEWTEGFAQIPSYLVEIPKEKVGVGIKTAGGKHIEVAGGDFIVVDALGDGKTSVQAIERGMMEKTYRNWE